MERPHPYSMPLRLNARFCCDLLRHSGFSDAAVEVLAKSMALEKSFYSVLDDPPPVPCDGARYKAQELGWLAKRIKRALAQDRRQVGRPRSSREEISHERQLAKSWRTSKAAGISQADFAKDSGLSLKDFQKLLNRVSKREKRSDK